MVQFFSRSSLITLITLVLAGCTSEGDKEATWRNEILQTDKEFSKLSGREGMKKAFIEFIDDDGILLRPDHPPIVGANAIEYLTEINDSSFTLTWQPTSAAVSSSGDLGYSYGIYTLQLQDTSLQGTYVSIWKKQKDKKWKFVLDTGNEGIKDARDSTGQ